MAASQTGKAHDPGAILSELELKGESAGTPASRRLERPSTHHLNISRLARV